MMQGGSLVGANGTPAFLKEEGIGSLATKLNRNRFKGMLLLRLFWRDGRPQLLGMLLLRLPLMGMLLLRRFLSMLRCNWYVPWMRACDGDCDAPPFRATARPIMTFVVTGAAG